jgi:hypothetical protein
MAARDDVSSQVPGGIIAAFLFRAEGVSGEETHSRFPPTFRKNAWMHETIIESQRSQLI